MMNWSAEKKKTILDIHKLPTADGKPITVKEICLRYGISQNTFYRWLRAYEQYGMDGLQPKARTSYRSQSRKSETVNAILELAQRKPQWSPQKIADYLARQGVRISVPTVRARLQEHHLGSLIERLVAAEKAYIENKDSLPDEVVQLLRKHNPCFDDYIITRPHLGNKIFLGVIKFNFAEFADYRVLVGIDLQSAYAIVELWRKDIARKGGQRFKGQAVSYFFERYQIDQITSMYYPPSYYRHTGFKDIPDIRKSECSYSSITRTNAGVYEQLRAALKIALASAFQNGLSSAEEDLKEWINKWVEEYNLKPGRITYPTFGKSPLEVFQTISKKPDTESNWLPLLSRQR